MKPLLGLLGLLLVLAVLWDAFETIILPRRARGRFRLTRLFYLVTWRPWAEVASHIPALRQRETYLSFFGPLSLILLLATWAIVLVVGYGFQLWGWGGPLHAAHGAADLPTALYMSGTTFFTLGLGDVTSWSGAGRLVSVLEAGTGFAVLAAVIGYLPVLYGAFSRREVNVSLLDARAGSPRSAGELLRRHAHLDNADAVAQFFREWERWAAEVMEGHLSYPVLAYYRSQHENQSWLSALTAILDTSTLFLVGIQGLPTRPAALTFATARHAAVDLAREFGLEPRPPVSDRLPPATVQQLRDELAAAGVELKWGEGADERLSSLRSMYEPWVNALSHYLLMPLPPWLPTGSTREYWRHMP